MKPPRHNPPIMATILVLAGFLGFSGCTKPSKPGLNGAAGDNDLGKALARFIVGSGGLCGQNVSFTGRATQVRVLEGSTSYVLSDHTISVTVRHTRRSSVPI